MTANRIRELREAKGLSQSDLGALIGGVTKYKISRLENGETRLDLDTAVKIARALGAPIAAVMAIEADGGLQEDAAPYQPGPHDPLYRLADSARARTLLKVQSNVLDEVGIRHGDVLLIDMSPQAVENVKPLALVVAQLYSREEMLEATTLLRQFVPPHLLVTNSKKNNHEPLNMTAADVHIKGVVISSHHAIASGLA